MNNSIKAKKKKEYSHKSIIFWAFVGAIVLVLITVLVVQIFRSRGINSYQSVTMLQGEEIFQQEEDKYLVLLYSFDEENEESEMFNNTVYKYLEYIRDFPKAGLKIYGMDMDEAVNQKCLRDDSEKLGGATKYVNYNDENDEDVLKVNSDSIPLLLIMVRDPETNKVSVDNTYKEGNDTILTYLDELKK